MATVLEQLAAGQAKTFAEVACGSSSLGKLLQREGVPDSPELQRILALPRRVWETSADTADLVRLLTAELRAPAGAMTLHKHQAVALAELADGNGLVGAMKVGTGKTLISYLAPVLLGARRPVLLIPAKLRGKTERDFETLAQHWKKLPSYTVIGYQELGLSHNEKLLANARPDLIVADEGHYLKNREAAVTRRVERYLAEHEGTRLIIMSGTLIEERDIPEFQHLMRWCLVEGMPVPARIEEALVWSRALDSGVPMSARMAAGALEKLASEGEEVRAAFDRRIRETPGVVVTRDVEVAASLQIHTIGDAAARPGVSAPGVVVPTGVREAISQAWDGKKPSGEAIEEGDETRIVSQLALGFYYEWDRPAPQAWLEARRKYKQIERMVLDQHRAGLDSPEQVELAIALGKLGRVEQYERWRAVRDLFQPLNIPRWLDYAIVDEIAALAKKLGPDIVIWTHYWAPGDALRERHGFRFFRHNGEDAHGPIEDATGTIVASIAGCGEGHNLQHHYHKNLVITPPTEPSLWEQFIGRTHRAGQKADTVNVHALAHVPYYRDILGRLRTSAKGTSRLAIADWV